jgi:hypothetical protein
MERNRSWESQEIECGGIVFEKVRSVIGKVEVGRARRVNGKVVVGRARRVNVEE